METLRKGHHKSAIIKREELSEVVGELPCDADLDELLKQLNPHQYAWYKGLIGNEARLTLDTDIRRAMLIQFLLRRKTK